MRGVGVREARILVVDDHEADVRPLRLMMLHLDG
jgi:hypothetical protein